MPYLIRQSHWLIFVIGWLITGWAAIYVDKQIERKAQDSFYLHVQDMEAAVVKRLRSYEDILYGVAGLYQASDKVTPEQFDAYGDSLNINERYPALKTVNFAQYFSQKEREDFIRNYETDTGGRNGKLPHLLERDGDEYMVLTRAYPSALSFTLGIDVFQNTRRRILESKNDKNALKLSSDYLPNIVFSSGAPIIPPGTNSMALAARLGIFKRDRDNMLRLIGTSGIGFIIPSFFREAIPPTLAKTLHYKMSSMGRLNGKKYASPISIFDSRNIGTGIDPSRFSEKELLRKHFDIAFGGALFRVEVAEQRNASIGRYEQYLPMVVLAGGFLFFASIGILARRILSDNAELDAAVNKRTIELQCEVNRTKSLERELALVIESERTRIGRELHDDLGQRLTAISVSAEILASGLLSIDPKLAVQADDLGRATSEAMMQVRTLAHGLMPVAPDKEGLRDALMDLAMSISRLSGIHCAFDFDDPVDILDENVSAHLYRIVQEALNNAIRHAHAKSIEIRLDEIDGKISLSISDDGCGFDQAGGGGLGLSTIAHRASIIGYDLQIESSAGNGTTIRVTEC